LGEHYDAVVVEELQQEELWVSAEDWLVVVAVPLQVVVLLQVDLVVELASFWREPRV
jgi:hypothetical protein